MSEAEGDRRQIMAKAVQEIRDLRARLRDLESARDGPIAIVGMGLRMPGGVSDSRSFWELLERGGDATAEVPASRWDVDDYYDANPDAPGKMSTRRGSFVSSVDDFDAAFFGISPREARSMDPQQRLLMEVTWEALENAGMSPHGLFGRAVGVYVGICSSMHTCNMWDPTNLERIDAYHGTGSTFSVAAGRLSHFLGLTGPALAVDTACSSSLVALHQACLGLRAGECEVALVGGVNLLLGPQVSVSFTKARMLSPDGRCKAFAASADGYGRGEGCGVLVLRRLSDAIERRERVLAVVRGSAINHDGHSSSLTVPNGPAQVRVIRQALEQAGVSPDQVSYLEAHGTGTPLGDPIEVNALGEVFSAGRTRARPLILGSVKANIGHLEAAAGISGLIKVLVALEHEAIPPHPMFGESTPHIAWRELAVELPRSPLPWRAKDGPRIAGVSSFGFSGTNAHVVIEEAPAFADAPRAPVERSSGAPEPAALGERPLHLLALSARSDAALRALVSAYGPHLARSESAAGDIAFTANVGRAHFAHRACAIGATSADLGRDLERLSRAAPSAPAGAPGIAFLFTGQGSQTAGIGRALYATQPTFRQCVDRCAAIVDPLLPESIRGVMFDASGGERLGQTRFTQPALFILEYALAELWRAWGVRPLAVLGHSLGEYVAACVAGVMSLNDALTLVVARGRLMQALPAAGCGDPAREPAMVAIMAEAEAVAVAIAQLGATVSIAAINGPRHTVLSGLARDVNEVAAAFERRGVRVKALAVSHAFHSPLMEPMLDALEAEADRLALQSPAIPLVANLHGGLADVELARGSYWRRHAREAVRFAHGVRTLRELGCNVFLEIGPRPALIALGQQTLEGDELAWIPSLSGGDEWRSMLEAVAGVYVAGASIDWNGFEKEAPRRRVSLPTYPFERKHYPVAKPAQRSPQALRLAPVLQPRSAASEREAPAWFYAPSWEPAPVRSAVVAPERWLIWADRQGVGAALAEEIQARGGSVHVVPAGEISGASSVSRVLDECAGAGPVQHIIHLGSLDANAAGTPSSPARALAVQLGCASALHLVQAVARRAGPMPRLGFVTAGGVAAGGAPVDPAQAPLWGWARSVGLELPELNPTLVDLDPESPARAVELYEALCKRETGAGVGASRANAGAETQVALRRGERLVLRLRPADVPLPAEPLRSEATYLVTGGTGALGLLTARRLAALGARHLVLTSRRHDGVSAERAAQRAATERVQSELAARGIACEVVLGDVANADDVDRVLETIRRTPWPLRGVFHAAGVSGTCDLLGMDVAELDRVLAPKWQGGWNLHAACAGRELDHFVGYSSLAALWGARGRAHYAAANAFLDGLCAYRRARGEPGVSIQWGPWDSPGMGDAEQRRELDAIGISIMGEDSALACFEHALRAEQPNLAVADVDWPKLRAHFEARGPRPFFMHLGAASAAAAPDLDAAPLARRLAALAAPDERRELVAFLRSEVQAILESEHPPDVEQGLFEMGFDSLMAVELARRLERALGRRVLTAVIFDHPRIAGLASHLLSEVLPLPLASVRAPARPAATEGAASERAPAHVQRPHADAPVPLAIVGMGCRFPGGADTPSQLWELFRDGRDATGEVPQGRRGDAGPANVAGRIDRLRGGFLADVAGFDPWFFRIAPRVAAAMDPQHRLLLEVAWEALEDGALAPWQLAQASTGVFVGITSGEYATLLLARGGAEGFDGHGVTGTPLFSAAGRLSYSLGLQGPSMSLDTACSSSLTALHLACQSLRQGECQWALASGVNLLLAAETTTALQRTGALSPAGRCKSFAADADGYARSEGCGVLLLTRLDDALAAGHRVRAILRNSGVNHNGASGGYTVPSGRAQEELIRRVWHGARVSPADVDYVEAHATATPLGDPIEVRALGRVVEKARPAERPLLIGSAKTNLGHCESAAGVAGVIKVVLSLEQEVLPPHLHCEHPTPQVPWDELPVRITRQATAWPRGARTRLAGVSSFGMGGTNAHVLIEEAPPARPRASGERHPGVLCLSARSSAALVEQARRLREHLVRHPELELADVAHTTRIGRHHFAHRACLRGGDTAGLLGLLDALIAGQSADGAHRGCASEPLPELAFRFQGLNPPVAAVARGQYQGSPSFRAAIDECMITIGPLLRLASPLDLWPSDGSSRSESLDRVAAFCTAYALAETWQRLGLTPRAVTGEGGGEHVAACFARLLPLGSMLAWLAGGATGAPPSAATSAAPRCAVVAASSLDRHWRSVPIDGSAARAFDAELAELYVAGFGIDWEAVSAGDARRVGLPTYPFERQPYWVDDAIDGARVATAAVAPASVVTTLAPVVAPAAVATLAPLAAPAAVAALAPAVAPALGDEDVLQAVMLQQLQMVSLVLDEQLAFLGTSAS